MRTAWILAILLAVSFFPAAQVPGEREESIHRPLVDLDGDLYAPEAGFRGSDWKGRDSDDLDASVHPGVWDSENGMFDDNCNGIHGWTPDGYQTYEEKFCKDSQPRGVVIFGDSAAAAFHIPKQWVKDKGLTPAYRELVVRDVHNEMDWPQKSWATGFDPSIEGRSIYLRMRERNLANHRDYQNLAVNGAKARSLVEQVTNFQRRPGDIPVLAFIAYIGNDVCKKNIEDMTKTEEFRDQLLQGLAALDAKIPAGSHVLLMGLVDGRILWNVMSERMHPLGITYAEFYEFLHESQGNPCRTWLTSDKASRDRASERARELSSVARQIAAERKYTNFEMAYMDFPLERIFTEWLAQGKDPAELIESVDGFHPSHTTHRLLADIVWEELTLRHPSFVGPVNPHNDAIRAQFGDQGGH